MKHCEWVIAICFFSFVPKINLLIQILRDAKELMLWCATPEAVVRLQKSELPFEEQETIQTCYWVNQKHSSLAEYLRYRIREQGTKGLFAQVQKFKKKTISRPFQIPCFKRISSTGIVRVPVLILVL